MIIQLLPEAALVVAALVLLGTVAASKRPLAEEAASWLAAGGVLLAGLCWWFAPRGIDAGSVLLAADPLSHAAKGMVLGLGLLAALLPPARSEMEHPGEYFALLLFAMTGLLLAVGSTHLMFIFVALELAGLSFYLLAGFPRTPRAAEASLKYFLFGGVSAAFMLFGISLLYGASGGVTLAGISHNLVSSGSNTLAMTGLAMLLAGLAFKLAAAPFHYWAPDVYQGAPATTVALVSAASKATGVVVMLRILQTGFSEAAGSAAWGNIAAGWSLWLAVLAAVSMILGNVLALAQTSVRRLLAYSAIANAGYLLVGFAANGPKSAAAALFYVVVYGLATLGAVAVTAAVERDRGDDKISSFAGLIQRSPFQAVCLLVFLTSLAGIPPLAGFVGKFSLFSHALAEGGGMGLVWLVGLAAVLSAVSLYYYLSVLKQAFVVAETQRADVIHGMSWSHALCIGLPALAIVLFGVFPALLAGPIQQAVVSFAR